MAIPSTPTNPYVQTGNGQVFISADISAGATAYPIQRSTDGVNFTALATPSSPQFLDTTVTLGQQYWYQIAALQSTGAFASATLTFTGQPIATQTFSVANTVFTAVASGATGNQFNIGGSVANTLANIAAAVNASIPLIVSASPALTVVTFTATQPGFEGNGLQFSTALSNSVAAGFSNGINIVGISPYTAAQSVVPTPTAEVSLGQLRLMAQQRADRVKSNFVTVPEWNTYINQSMFELYDLLVTVYEDYYIAPTVSFLTNGNQFLYPLPDGTNYNAAAPFYKLVGVDLGLNTANNAYVTIDKFNFVDRNRFVYPNSNSTIYGVFNMQYRVMGSNIEFIPTPTANQTIRLWYVPRLRQLLMDNDITSTGISGWIEYVITDAAIKALQKEESDVTVLGMQKMALIKRIEDSASNRDVGRPDTIGDTRRGGNGWQNGPSWGGPVGGW